MNQFSEFERKRAAVVVKSKLRKTDSMGLQTAEEEGRLDEYLAPYIEDHIRSQRGQQMTLRRASSCRERGRDWSGDREGGGRSLSRIPVPVIAKEKAVYGTHSDNSIRKTVGGSLQLYRCFKKSLQYIPHSSGDKLNIHCAYLIHNPKERQLYMWIGKLCDQEDGNIVTGAAPVMSGMDLKCSRPPVLIRQTEPPGDMGINEKVLWKLLAGDDKLSATTEVEPCVDTNEPVPNSPVEVFRYSNNPSSTLDTVVKFNVDSSGRCNRLPPSVLSDKGVYIVECGYVVYVWTGKAPDAVLLTEEALDAVSKTYHNSGKNVHHIHGTQEPIVFKLLFERWTSDRISSGVNGSDLKVETEVVDATQSEISSDNSSNNVKPHIRSNGTTTYTDFRAPPRIIPISRSASATSPNKLHSPDNSWISAPSASQSDKCSDEKAHTTVESPRRSLVAERRASFTKHNSVPDLSPLTKTRQGSFYRKVSDGETSKWSLATAPECPSPVKPEQVVTSSDSFLNSDRDESVTSSYAGANSDVSPISGSTHSRPVVKSLGNDCDSVGVCEVLSGKVEAETVDALQNGEQANVDLCETGKSAPDNDQDKNVIGGLSGKVEAETVDIVQNGEHTNVDLCETGNSAPNDDQSKNVIDVTGDENDILNTPEAGVEGDVTQTVCTRDEAQILTSVEPDDVEDKVCGASPETRNSCDNVVTCNALTLTVLDTVSGHTTDDEEEERSTDSPSSNALTLRDVSYNTRSTISELRTTVSQSPEICKPENSRVPSTKSIKEASVEDDVNQDRDVEIMPDTPNNQQQKSLRNSNPFVDPPSTIPIKQSQCFCM